MYDFNDLKGLFSDGISSCQVSMKVGSSELNNLVGFSAVLLSAAPAAESWLAYVDSIAQSVVKGIVDMLLASLRYLLSQVQPCAQMRPVS